MLGGKTIQKMKTKTELLAVNQSVNVSQFFTELKKQQRSCGKEASRIMEKQSIKVNPDANIETLDYGDYNYHNYAAATFLEVNLHMKSNIFIFKIISA